MSSTGAENQFQVDDNGHVGRREGRNEVEFPRCFRTLVVKIEKTNSNSTRDFSKRINFTRVDLFVWSTLVVKIKKTQESTPSVIKESNEDKENIILLQPIPADMRKGFSIGMPNCVCLLLQDLLQSCSRGGEEESGRHVL